MSNSSIWSIERTLSGATTPGQSGPESNGNEGVQYILKNSRITGASLSIGAVLPLYRDAVNQFYNPSWLGYE